MLRAAIFRRALSGAGEAAAAARPAPSAPLSFTPRASLGLDPSLNWSLAASQSALLPSPTQLTFRNTAHHRRAPTPTPPASSTPTPTTTPSPSRASRAQFQRLLRALSAHASTHPHLHVVDATVGSDFPSASFRVRVVTPDAASAARAQAMLERAPLRALEGGREGEEAGAWSAAPLVYVAPEFSVGGDGGGARMGVGEGEGGFVVWCGREVVVGGTASAGALARAFVGAAGREAGTGAVVVPGAAFSAGTGALLVAGEDGGGRRDVATSAAGGVVVGPTTGGVVWGERGIGRALRSSTGVVDESVPKVSRHPTQVVFAVGGEGVAKVLGLKDAADIGVAAMAAGAGLSVDGVKDLVAKVEGGAGGSKSTVVIGGAVGTVEKWLLDGEGRMPREADLTDGVRAALRVKAVEKYGEAAVAAVAATGAE